MRVPAGFLALFVAAAFLCGESQQQTASDSYVAAVVEYIPTFVGATVAAQLAHRTAEYVDFVRQAADQFADIVAFPEATLTLGTIGAAQMAQRVPDPADRVLPCSEPVYAGTPVAAVSCAARDNGLYVVINLSMRQPCEEGNGGEAAECLYNTNVVFNREGRVISTYRKFNLYDETGHSKTAEPDISTFDTDFGVRFGHFICFDLLFETPANVLVRRGVQNFVFPTMWFAELPFLSGVQVQQGWAFAHNVNVLAAAANNASVGSSGSGIYAGRAGALASLITETGQSRLLVHSIRKVPSLDRSEFVRPPASTEPVANILTKVDITKYTLLPLQPGLFASHSRTIDGFTCSFAYTLRTVEAEREGYSAYQYYSAMYNGKKSYDGFADSQLRVCAVVACTDPEDLRSCGRRFGADVRVQQRFVFAGLQVFGTFAATQNGTNMVMPSTLTTGLLPLNSEEFAYEESMGNAGTNVTMRLLRSNDLLTFGVYSVDFSGSGRLVESGVLMLISLMLVLWFGN